MRAVVWHGPGELRVQDVPEPPEPGPGTAVVEVAFCGICGTDLHEYLEGPVMIRPNAHPLTGMTPPFALGHEFSGNVVAVGPDVTHTTVGTRVAVDPCWRCGRCYWCRRGDYHLCKIGGSVGLASPGALAERVLVPAEGLVPLPGNVTFRDAAVAEPLAVGLHAIQRGGVRLGDSVLIVGFGPIGAAVLLAARLAGAATILVSEPRATRRELARNLGAQAINPTDEDVRSVAYEATARVGIDVVFDCSGVPALLAASLDLARRGGVVVAVGVGHGHAEIALNKLVLVERELVGAVGYRHDVERVVRLLAGGRLSANQLISRVVVLDDVPATFDELANGEGELKVLVNVSGSL